MSTSRIIMNFVDGQYHKNQRQALVAFARTSGRYGKHNACVPGDAAAWKSSLETPFTQNARWARYQKAKCGNNECSVHYEKVKRKAPVADGISPTASNPSRLGCLILEAKSSAATVDKQSLYGTKRGQQERTTKRPKPRGGRRGGKAQAENVPFLAIFAITSYTSPNSLEDWIWNEWAKNRGKFRQSKWGLIRTNQIDALIRYEMACSNPDVPLTKYVVIVERSFMKQYFQSIITPNGMVAVAGFRGPNWK